MFERGYYKVTTAPTEEPVSLATAKLHLKVDFSDEDDLITELVKVGRQYAEAYTNRAIMTQTIQIVYSCFPGATPANPRAFLKLFSSPIQQLSKVEYYNANNDLTTLYENGVTAETVYLDAITEPARIMAAVGSSWPTTADRIDAVKVTAVCGYSTAADVPAPIKHAILLMIGEMYERRENYIKKLPTAAEYLLGGWCVREL